ncbi:hypothetical protein [Streptomyces sp. NPDC056683]|uniref:hypothetical protein n=1 Tax=Streptomyces sp. NPDC056683 TaxID=3345910 RepID=UPI003697E1E0
MSQTPRHVLTTTQHTVPRCPERCPRTAGFGTDHPGTGRCRQHDLEAAAAARAAHRVIPPAVFTEPAYVDGLPYPDTAPGLVPYDDDDEWGYDEEGRVVDLRGDVPAPFAVDLRDGEPTPLAM